MPPQGQSGPPDGHERTIATCQTFEQLRDAIAAYCHQQQITRQALDRRAGLAEGHSAKLLSPTSVRRFGATSLRWILAALDLEIVLQVRSKTDLSTRMRA